MPNEPNGFMVRLIDGPYAGKEIHFNAGIEDPADEIVVSETQYVSSGTVYCFDRGTRELLEGDQIYRVRNKSQLPPEHSHPNIMRGAEYEFIRSITEENESETADA